MCQGLLQILEKFVLGVQSLLDLATQLLDQARVDLRSLDYLLNLNLLLLLLVVEHVDLLGQEVILLLIVPLDFLHVLLEVLEVLLTFLHDLLNLCSDVLQFVVKVFNLFVQILEQESGRLLVLVDLVQLVLFLVDFVFRDDFGTVELVFLEFFCESTHLVLGLQQVLLEFVDLHFLVFDELDVVTRDVSELLFNVVLVLLVLPQQAVDVCIQPFFYLVYLDLQPQFQVLLDAFQPELPFPLGHLER